MNNSLGQSKHCKTNSSNMNHIQQNLQDVQSNRNSLSNHNLNIQRNSQDSSSLTSNRDVHKFNPFKPISINQQKDQLQSQQIHTNQQIQKTGGIAYDYQITGGNIINNQNAVAVKRNSSSEAICAKNNNDNNFNNNNNKSQPSNKKIQQQILADREQQYGYQIEPIQNGKQEIKIYENGYGQSQRGSDSKKIGLIPHHGGSKSLDQQAFKRMGSCPNNPVQGMMMNNQLHQSANHNSQQNFQNKMNINYIQSQNQNQNHQNQYYKFNQVQGQGQVQGNNNSNNNNQNSKRTLSQMNGSENEISQQLTKGNSLINNQMNIQMYLNQNKPNLQQQTNSFNNPSSCSNNKHGRAASSNILQDYQSLKNFEPIKQPIQLDYISNQPYFSNQIDNKGLILSQEIDDEQLPQSNQYTIQTQQKSIPTLQNLQQQQQQKQKLQYWLSQVDSSLEKLTNDIDDNENNDQLQNYKNGINSKNKKDQYYEQKDFLQKNEHIIFQLQKQQQQQQQISGINNQPFLQQNNNLQNQIGLCDMSAINNSINQRDISIIKPSNVQDISCFSRDQSMFLDANKDLSINMRDQSSFFHINNNFKKNNNNNLQINTLSSGFDLQTPQQLQQQDQDQGYIIQMAEKEEYPTLSNPNFNQDKSLILEGLKDMSINYSKVEEISNILEQEKEKNYKLEEKINYQDNILKKMTDFQNDLFQNYEQAQNAIKQLKTENNQDQKLMLKIKSLQDENANLREQIIKAEEVHELKQKDLMNQLIQIKHEKLEIQSTLQSQIDSLKSNLNKQKKYYEDKINKYQFQIQQQQQQQDKEKQYLTEKQTLDKQIKNNNNNKSNLQDLNEQNNNNSINAQNKQIITQLQQLLDIQKESEIIPKIKQIADKDMLKLVDCLTEMMISFAPEGYFEKKPSLKQIWKWLKEVLKEYMRNTSDLKKSLLYVGAETQSDFMKKLEKLVFENESYHKIIDQIKQYFNLNEDKYQNLYELQLFIEKKNNQSQLLKQNIVYSDHQLHNIHTQQESSYTNLTTDSSKI